MAKLLVFTVLLSAIFLNNFANSFKINPEAEAGVIFATNLTKFLEENPDAVALTPSVIQPLKVGSRLTYSLGTRVRGIPNYN